MAEGSIALPAVGPAVLAWAALALLALAAFLSVAAALLERSGLIRLRHFAHEADGTLRTLFERPLAFEAFRFVLSALARIALAAWTLVLALLFLELGSGMLSAAGWALAATALATLVIELANRRLVRRSSEVALERLTPTFRLARLILAPLVVLLTPLMVGAHREDDDEEEEDEASDDEIEAFIAIGEREGILEPDEVDLVRGVVDFGDTQVKSVMTPRTDIVGAPVDATLSELAALFVESRHSRIPLFEESLDHVVGVLLMRDLLGALLTDAPPAVRELAKVPYFVPGTKAVDELLRELQQRQQHIAMVVDEYGGTAGLVTMEDILEEIVGEIADEHDEVLQEVWTLEDGTWRVDGKTHLDELTDLVGVDFEEATIETVAGLVLSELGDVPQEGAVVVAHGLVLTVEKVEQRRIVSVRVARTIPGERSEETDER